MGNQSTFMQSNLSIWHRTVRNKLFCREGFSNTVQVVAVEDQQDQQNQQEYLTNNDLVLAMFLCSVLL